MKTKKNRVKIMVIAFAILFIALYVLIYIVPQVSNIFVETYTVEYGPLEISAESSYLAVRDERLYVADGSGEIDRVVTEGRLMRKNSRIVTVGGIAYYSQDRGIISYCYDGLEEVYTPDTMRNITEADLPDTTSEEEGTGYQLKDCAYGTAQTGSPVFKVVDNKEWYLVCWLENGDADGYEAGKSITAEFEDGIRIKMEVLEANKQGDKMQIILSCNRYYEKFDRIRTGKCRLIKASRNGIIIDVSSIVEEDGQKGVYVMSKRLDKASFVPIKILLTDGQKAAVAMNTFTNDEGNEVDTVENYDEILKTPKKGSEQNAD